MRRAAAASLVAVAVLLLAGCSGNTTGASSVHRTWAQVNAQGSCDHDCSYFFRYRPAGTSGWPYSTPVRSGIGSTNGHTGSFGELLNLLTTEMALQPGTTYRYQVCGRDAGFSDYVCVGPDGRTGSSSRFTTPDGDAVTGRATITSGPLDGYPVFFDASSDPTGNDPEGAAVRFDRSGGTVTCLRVNGSRATVGTSTLVFFVTPDSYKEVPTTGDPSVCPPFSATGASTLSPGITIRDMSG